MDTGTLVILYALAGMLFLQLAMQAADEKTRQSMGEFAGVFMILAIIIVLTWPIWMVVDVARFIKGKIHK